MFDADTVVRKCEFQDIQNTNKLPAKIRRSAVTVKMYFFYTYDTIRKGTVRSNKEDASMAQVY